MKKAITLLSLVWSISFMAQAQYSLEWARSIGGSKTEYGYGIAVDGSGNVYATGSFQGTVDFDPGPGIDTLVSAGNSDIFIVKYDAVGNYLWARGIGGSTYEHGYSVATDKWGNVYVTGTFEKTVDFDPGPGMDTLTSTGLNDIFLAKYDANGNYVWAGSMGGSGTDIGFGVVVDEPGNVYITGYFAKDDADFNPGAGRDILFNAGGLDAFIAKYDTRGNYLWARNLGGSTIDHGRGITVDQSGYVYITGFFNSKNFDPGGTVDTLTSQGDNDIFLAKYDTAGNYVWSGSMGAKNNDQGYGVAVDKSGNVYVTGLFTGTVDFDPGVGRDTLMSASAASNDVFLAKYDVAGNYVWGRSMGGPQGDAGYEIDVDEAGHIYITGIIRATADFNLGLKKDTLVSKGLTDIFVAKYDAQGNYEWAESMGNTSLDQGQGIAVDKSGNIYVTGTFQKTVDFAPGSAVDTLVGISGDDVFVLKLACSDTSFSYLTVSTCEANYTLNDSTYTVSGTYTQVLHRVSGCDSTITLDLDLYQLNPVINVDSFTLGTAGEYVTYQWIKDGAPVPGATSRTYEVSGNGDYQVIVTNEDGCAATSEVYTVKNYTGIAGPYITAGQIRIYPNPSEDIVYIQAPVQVTTTVTDIEGRGIRQFTDTQKISLRGLRDGLYFLHISDKNNILIKIEKVIKQSK